MEEKKAIRKQVYAARKACTDEKGGSGQQEDHGEYPFPAGI